MENNTTCDIAADVLESFKAFRFRKSKANAAIILKVDMKQLSVVKDQVLEDIQISDIVEELPETSPRFLVLSYEYKHKDGRISYPLVGIFYNPPGSSDQQKMLYASTKFHLFQKAEIVGKIYDVTDAEDLTDEWLTESLNASSTRP